MYKSSFAKRVKVTLVKMMALLADKFVTVGLSKSRLNEVSAHKHSKSEIDILYTHKFPALI